MVLSIVAANAWCILQLIILGSFARTVRIRTVYAAVAVGLYLCVPLAVVLQSAWTGLFASLMGMSASQLVRIASYTVDPFVEELIKLLPLTLLVMVPTFRRQWSLTDFVLIAAATGAGFGLAEDLYRFGASADRAQGIAGGWALVFSEGYMLVPSIGKILTSWLPVGVAASGGATRLNVHLIWSAVGGLAVGLALLVRTNKARVIALGLFVYVALDHAGGNMSNLGDSWLAWLAWPIRTFSHLRWLMPIAALAAAWWFDQRRQGARDSDDLLLKAEQSASSPLQGILAATCTRLPWSLISVDRFVRMRRAFRTENAAASVYAAPLYAVVVHERDRVDRELAKLESDAPALLPPGWSLSHLRGAIRRPAVIIWLVVMTPSVLWFVVGGWPQTAALQAFMTQPIVWKLLFPISVLTQAWIAWRTVAGLKSWSRNRGASIGDDAAIVGLRAACGLGAVSLGAFSLARMLGGIAPGSSILASLHAQDAANSLTPGGGSMIAGSAGAFAPPPPSLDLPDTAGASAGSSSGSSAGTSNSNADGGRTSVARSGTNNTPPRAPEPPDQAAAARARADAAAADLAAAQQRRRDVQNALESSEIKQATDQRNDPAAAKAQADAVNEARAADKQADADVTAAQAKAEAAKAEADAQAEAARTAADQRAAAERKAADPLGVAAEEAAKAADLAEQRANNEFMKIDQYDSNNQVDPSGAANRRAANEAAILARQQADAAKAAADAAKAARDTLAAQTDSTGWKPDKP